MEDKKRREIKEERTAASKLFENEDHSFTKEIYLDDVHYQDEEGIWQEMDDTLTEEMDEDTGFLHSYHPFTAPAVIP